jgi:rRNA-processing protein FCF1
MGYVIIDTSSILFGFSFKKSVFESAAKRFPDYKPIVSRGIIRELSSFSTLKGKKGANAKIALLELKAKKIDVYNINRHPDSWILDFSFKKRDSIVITNDTALARKLASRSIRVFKMSRSGMLKMFNE